MPEIRKVDRKELIALQLRAGFVASLIKLSEIRPPDGLFSRLLRGQSRFEPNNALIREVDVEDLNEQEWVGLIKNIERRQRITEPSERKKSAILKKRKASGPVADDDGLGISMLVIDDLSGSIKDFAAALNSGIAVEILNEQREKLQTAISERSLLDLADRKFTDAKLAGINLSSYGKVIVDLSGSDFSGADLRGANLSNAITEGAHFNGADLRGCNLTNIHGKTIFEGAILDGANVTGVHPMNIVTNENTSQKLLKLTDGNLSLQADGLLAVHALWLYANGERTREAMKALLENRVPLLGRFSEGRIDYLYALADVLRGFNMSPVVFDFENLENRTLIETIGDLASLSKFVVADLSAPRSVFQELQSFVPSHPNVIIISIIEKSEKPVATFESLRRYDWVAEPIVYDKRETAQEITDKVLRQFERMTAKLRALDELAKKFDE